MYLCLFDISMILNNNEDIIYRCKISNSKKFQKWTKELISRLESAWGLELEEIRKNKHLVIKGNINGIPYRQSFSTTPKTISGASASIIRETKRKLLRCGVDINEINKSMPNLAFVSYKVSENEMNIIHLVKFLNNNPQNYLENNMLLIDIKSFMKEFGENYKPTDIINDGMKKSGQVVTILDILQENLTNIAYNQLLEPEYLSKLEDTFKNTNVSLIPANNQIVSCNDILLAISSGKSSNKTGIKIIMRQIRKHLIDCYENTKIVILITDTNDRKIFEESALDFEAHKKRDVVFLTGLVSGEEIKALPF